LWWPEDDTPPSCWSAHLLRDVTFLADRPHARGIAIEVEGQLPDGRALSSDLS
jgi:hypothetical protein